MSFFFIFKVPVHQIGVLTSFDFRTRNRVCGLHINDAFGTICRIQPQDHWYWTQLFVRPSLSIFVLILLSQYCCPLSKFLIVLYVCVCVLSVSSFCRDHVNELKNAVPEKPLIFLKPSTAYVTEGSPIKVASGTI